MAQTLVRTDFHFPQQDHVYHGKVRDVYFLGSEQVAMIATDRISAFDVVLPKGIPYKGQVLNQIATYFLEATRDIVPNWLLSAPDPMVSLGLRCEPFRVEMVIRGYLTGSSWRAYQAGERTLCGIQLPDGMREKDGKIYLIDEIHTPDSSRYFYAEGYEERFERGEEQKQLSKEFVRQWLIKNGFQGRDGEVVPEMTEEYCQSVSDRYIELYETVTGRTFVAESTDDLTARIERNVLAALH